MVAMKNRSPVYMMWLPVFNARSVAMSTWTMPIWRFTSRSATKKMFILKVIAGVQRLLVVSILFVLLSTSLYTYTLLDNVSGFSISVNTFFSALFFTIALQLTLQLQDPYHCHSKLFEFKYICFSR
jgi:hypothetical protein